MDEKVSEFLAVTGSNPEIAKAYLESCGGDVSTAVERFFANHEAPPSTDRHDDAPPAVNPQAPKATQSRPGVTGLGDLGDEEDEEDGPQDNEYYAGGEKSGVAVRGGKKTGDNVEDLFESAKQHGATQGTDSDLRGQTGTTAFTGQARTLTGDVTTHTPTQEPQPVTIAFYLNGIFTVDDGEPRSVDDPQNAEFVESIRQGTCPQELIRRGKPIKVNLVRKGTEYTPPEKPKYTAFSGVGQTLNSEETTEQTTYSELLEGGGEWEGADESQPTTSIQIRMYDGSRVVARFNYSHTIRDIRRFIAVARPDLDDGGVLMTGFPSKLLDDETQTVEQAELVNSVVVQKRRKHGA